MPISKDLSLKIATNILKERNIEEIRKRLQPRHDPLRSNLSRQTELTKNAQEQRLEVLEKQGSSLSYIRGKSTSDDPSIYQGNIENFIGLAQVPMGIIGPLRINGLYAHGDFYIPLATTEGALVASYNRGSRIISLSGGATMSLIYSFGSFGIMVSIATCGSKNKTPAQNNQSRCKRCKT